MVNGINTESPAEATDYALVWGGEEQRDGKWMAMNKFESDLDHAKRVFAHRLCQNYWYLTARYGFCDCDEFIRNYDKTFDDVDVDTWLDHTHRAIGVSHFCVLENACVWVLVDDDVLHATDSDGIDLKHILDSLPSWVRYPFEGRDREEKIAWLEDSVDKGFPLDQGVPVVEP